MNHITWWSCATDVDHLPSASALLGQDGVSYMDVLFDFFHNLKAVLDRVFFELTDCHRHNRIFDLKVWYIQYVHKPKHFSSKYNSVVNLHHP